MRRLRRVRTSRRRSADRARPARAAAPRPGGGGHRHAHDGKRVSTIEKRHIGLVGDHFSDATPSSAAFPARVAIGHNRYSTTGERHPPQRPAAVRRARPPADFAVAHNGNLTNALTLKPRTGEGRRGSLFQSTSDTEVDPPPRSPRASRHGRIARPLRQRAAPRSRAPTRWSRSPTKKLIGCPRPARHPAR